MAPPVSHHQFNQLNFGSNTPYDSFRNQRSLPSPNTMNSQFLGLNGNPAAGTYVHICISFREHLFEVIDMLNYVQNYIILISIYIKVRHSVTILP